MIYLKKRAGRAPATQDMHGKPRVRLAAGSVSWHLKKMFAFMRPYIFIYCLGIFLYNLQSFAFNFVVGLVSRNIVAGAVAGEPREIVMGTVFSLALYATFAALMGLGIYLGNRAFYSARLDLKQVLFRCFIRSGLEASQATHSGEGIAKMNTEADLATADIYWNVASSLLRPAIAVVFSSIVLFTVDWRIGLAGVGLGLVAYFSQSRFVKPLAKIGKERLDANTDAVKNMSDTFQGAISIRAFNMQEKALETASGKMNVLKLLDFRQAFISMWQNLFTTALGWLALAITFGFGGWLVATGQLDFPSLLLILPLMESIGDYVSGIGEAIAGLQPPLEAAKRIFAVIDNAPISEDKGSMEFDGSALHIKDLNFKYQHADSNTLHDINLDINVGEMVAFVGASGSGKSTILRIIAGFYEREHLGMTLGGTSSETASLAAWRENFAYVDQSCKLFDMTIKENIALGKKGKADDTEIIAAAKQAFAHDFIEQLEARYDAPCGEKGASLSGGQKQRIAIARALMKRAPILVFDEATSALDADSERAVMQTIASLRENHTILITTHNLANIATADKIVVMDGGRIAEMGRHEELMGKKGIYYELVNR